MEPTETYKAWLAGFFDGEGTVCLINANCRRENRQCRYRPRVSLYQKDQLDLLLEIRDFYGGSVHFIRSGYSKGVHMLDFERKEEMKNFLEDVIPYLRVKRHKAELVLAICSLNVGKNQHGFKEEKLRRRELEEEFKSLQ